MSTMFFSAMEFVLVIDKISKKVYTCIVGEEWCQKFGVILSLRLLVDWNRKSLVSFRTQQQGEADS